MQILLSVQSTMEDVSMIAQILLAVLNAPVMMVTILEQTKAHVKVQVLFCHALLTLKLNCCFAGDRYYTDVSIS